MLVLDYFHTIHCSINRFPIGWKPDVAAREAFVFSTPPVVIPVPIVKDHRDERESKIAHDPFSVVNITWFYMCDLLEEKEMRCSMAGTAC